MSPTLMALLSAFLFGINPIVLKLGLKKSNSDLAVFVGLVTGVPVLVLVAPFAGGLRFEQLTSLALFYFVLSGLLALVFGRAFLYSSIDRLGSLRAATFKNAAPLITAVLALLFLKEVVGWLRWGAIGLVIVGLGMVGRSASRQEQAPTLLGFIIASATAFFYGVRPIFSKLGLNESPLPLEATLIGYFTAILLYIGYFIVKGNFWPLRAGPASLFYFAVGGLLQSSGLLLLHYALQGGQVAVIYPISSSAPLLTFLLSYTVLRNQERLTLLDLAGTALVISGVILLLR